MLFDEIESGKWETTQRKGGFLLQPVSLSACILLCLSPLLPGKEHNVNTKTPIDPVRPLFCARHASLNFNISPTMFILFFTQHVDSGGQIKKYICKRRTHECRDPSANKSEQGRSICPLLLADTNTKGLPGNSFAQVWKGH